MALTQRDRDTLTPAQQAQIQAYTDQWNAANLANDKTAMAAANAGANAVRAQAGYSGGDNGVTYRAPNTYEAADAYWMTHTSPQQPSYGGDSLAAQYQSLFNAQNSAYEQALAAQKAANEAAVQKAVNSLEQQKTSTDRSYDDYARQAYVDRMNAQKGIDQRMAARGVTGGAAETTLLGLNTAYSDALRQMERSRIGDISALDQAIADARLTGDVSSAQATADAVREQTGAYADAMKKLLDRADTLNARQIAYAREDTANSQAWARQMALQMLAQGSMPDDETLSAAGMSRAQATTLLPQTYDDVLDDVIDLYLLEEDPARIRRFINAALSAGRITEEQAARLRAYYGG